VPGQRTRKCGRNRKKCESKKKLKKTKKKHEVLCEKAKDVERGF
jgi:hypothetical protein